MKRERISFLADNMYYYTERFAYYVGRHCAAATIQEVTKKLHLDWHAVKNLEKQYMRESLSSYKLVDGNAVHLYRVDGDSSCGVY